MRGMITPERLAERVCLALNLPAKDNAESLAVILRTALTGTRDRAAMAAKVVGCGLGAFGRPWRGRLLVGVGMIPRAEVALIVASSGIALHAFGAGVYAAIVFAVAATMIVSPALLGRLVPREGSEAKLEA